MGYLTVQYTIGAIEWRSKNSFTVLPIQSRLTDSMDRPIKGADRKLVPDYNIYCDGGETFFSSINLFFPSENQGGCGLPLEEEHVLFIF